jgi:hypothetical protein
MERFFKKEVLDLLKPYHNPVDFFNEHFDFIQIFEVNKDRYHALDSKTIWDVECITPNNQTVRNEPCYQLTENNKVAILYDCPKLGLHRNTVITKFEMLTLVRFKGFAQDAMNFVMYRVMKKQVPYMRVGCDYFKILTDTNRYGVKVKKITGWKKQEIIDDHGKNLLKDLPKFDGFTLSPNNVDYKEFIGGYYNLYARFPHKPVEEEVLDKSKFPNIARMMTHIFGANEYNPDQEWLGYVYLQILYLYPRNHFYILCLVSTERQTGKTTFMNFLEIMLGGNYISIKPDDLLSDFNEFYAIKNLIAVDEAVVEKSSAVERLKALVTSKTQSVNRKHVAQYQLPFYGKLVMNSNKEHDFMKIEHDEVRFWVRKIPPVTGERDALIEDKLAAEIPYLLKYLLSLPPLDLSKDRFIIPQDKIITNQLRKVQKESETWLKKELDEYLTDLMITFKANYFHVTPKILKERFFAGNNQVNISYIIKVLRDEYKAPQTKDIEAFYPLEKEWESLRTGALRGRYYTITNDMLGVEKFEENQQNNSHDISDGLPF